VTLHGNVSRVKNYKSIVIDAQHYTAAEIKKLKSGGRKVYSYLSIGSIATYRPYYNRFKKYALGGYTNWKSERWIDTSKKAWQDFVVNELVAGFKKKGVDGLWVDNTDVFYEFHRAPIFNGLVYILRRCKNKGFPIIINGGDVFVSHCIKSGKKGCFDGVMQEEVLTRIYNYNKNEFRIQLSSDRKYYEAYLKRVKNAGYSIALLEYAKGASMRQTIARYCKNHGYSYYIATNVALN
jgi:endo-alpha-1,4-polygalactosaminidase (GH114 family)